MKENDFEIATLEAIYWWNRNESYYHKYFSKLDIIYEDKELLVLFKSKIFEVFLREYSIRRNLNSGYNSVDIFIDELFKFNFVKKVIDGDIEIVNNVSTEIKQKRESTTKETKSLLSKIAFLINPDKFSLYDTFSSESLKEILKKEGNEINQTQLKDYSLYNKAIDGLIIKYSDIISSSIKNTHNYMQIDTINFFSTSPEAFKRRIFDKYLWLRSQKKKNLGRQITNNGYINFLNIK